MAHLADMLRDVPETELGERGGLVHPPDVLSLGGDCWIEHHVNLSDNCLWA